MIDSSFNSYTKWARVPTRIGGVEEIGSADGYINRTGEIDIKPQFESAASFSEGLALVRKDDESSYVDSSGKIVFDPEESSLAVL